MKATLHCFGASTACGAALRCLSTSDFVGYSRNISVPEGSLYKADLRDPASFQPVASVSNHQSIWISFAPIWLFADFLDYLCVNKPELLQGLRGVIACSSSSVCTKRFASNSFDRNLVNRLIHAEEKVLAVCRRLDIACYILRPTMIYGRVGEYCDRNLSLLLKYLRFLPVFPLLANSGLRQPIHASELASVALHLSHQLIATSPVLLPSECISIGGDTTLNYSKMVSKIQLAQPPSDSARRCLLLPIPNRLFFLLAAPLILFSPKTFEAVLRMGSNLSGFVPVHKLLGTNPQSFPIKPLSY